MSYSIATLLTSDLDDVFGENHAARRRAAIDRFSPKIACFCEPRGVCAWRVMAVIHANSGLSSGHISLSSVAPDILTAIIG